MIRFLTIYKMIVVVGMLFSSVPATSQWVESVPPDAYSDVPYQSSLGTGVNVGMKVHDNDIVSVHQISSFKRWDSGFPLAAMNVFNESSRTFTNSSLLGDDYQDSIVSPVALKNAGYLKGSVTRNNIQRLSFYDLSGSEKWTIYGNYWPLRMENEVQDFSNSDSVLVVKNDSNLAFMSLVNGSELHVYNHDTLFKNLNDTLRDNYFPVDYFWSQRDSEFKICYKSRDHIPDFDRRFWVTLDNDDSFSLLRGPYLKFISGYSDNATQRYVADFKVSKNYHDSTFQATFVVNNLIDNSVDSLKYSDVFFKSRLGRRDVPGMACYAGEYGAVIVAFYGYHIRGPIYYTSSCVQLHDRDGNVLYRKCFSRKENENNMYVQIMMNHGGMFLDSDLNFYFAAHHKSNMDGEALIGKIDSTGDLGWPAFTYLNNGEYSESSLNLDFYPNPTEGIVSIKGLEEDRDYHWRVTGMAGRVLGSKRLDSARSQIDLSHLNPGVYFLEVSDSQGIKEGQRIVVK